MKNLLLYILLLVSSASFGQTTVRDLEKAMDAFDNALMMKDSVALKKLLHDKVQYGHSNAWIETKKEVVADLFNGKLVYESIAVEQPVNIYTYGLNAYARYNCALQVLLDGKPLEIYLHVLQVWTKQTGKWQLINRQSTKQEKK